MTLTQEQMETGVAAREAYQVAVARLKNAHPEEYARIYAEERTSRGLMPTATRDKKEKRDRLLERIAKMNAEVEALNAELNGHA